MRWLLTWHRPVAADPAGVARFETDVSAVARVRVQRIAAVSERIVAVGIDCGAATSCQTARDRLRADPRVLDLQPDARRRAHAP